MGINIASTIGFGRGKNFTSGRVVGGQIGGKGSTLKAIDQARAFVGKLYKEYVLSGNFAKEMAARAILEIKKRTLDGRDARGKPFERYSSAYDKWKRKQGKHTGNVNMRLDGYMLDNIYFKPDGGMSGVITVRPFGVPGENVTSADLARYHNTGAGNNPKREFLAWIDGSPEDKRLKAFAKKRIQQRARAMARR